MPKYSDLYPRWDSEAFELPGAEIVGAIAPIAFKGAREAVGQKGGACPCCGQHVQVYRRSIYKRMAKCLIWLVSVYTGDWISLKGGPLFRGGDNAKLSYWHLIKHHPEDSDLYKPTKIGVRFAQRDLRLPKYAYVYDGMVQGFSKEKVNIDDCLEGDFDLSDIGIPAWSPYGDA